ncbi:MAG: glycoside hydrolase family 2 protein [Tyzzerella sp.]|nr:glycoside hydrolase family 2 protein [Tyzzerella sp.]
MKINWNKQWLFSKTKSNWDMIDLPHTWNGTDGQDGGNDYHRGTCYYKKSLSKAEIPSGKLIYLELEGTNSSADIYVNGEKAAHHDGGYSTWRVNLTPFLKDENEILIAVNNAPNDHVYPQIADFTFYGGIYRNVNLIFVDEAHFDLDYFGGPAVKVTPEVNGADAKAAVEVFLTGTKGNESLEYKILDGDTIIASHSATSGVRTVDFTIKNVHLWHGRKDPHLYTLQVKLLKAGQTIDERTVRFGCRTFEVDPEKGFILNGESYPLRGVSRHQDRPKIGNALLKEHHAEDMNLICEVGATTIRLAHYQHDQFFYDLCDERGMIVWAEIPYISRHMANGRENTLQQMKELIVQNYHHPCIVVWGLSNEITMGGAADPDLVANHHALNNLAHELDSTRLTTQAVVTMCSMDEEYVHIPDVVSYNHYFGWYGGETDMNGEFMDRFHAKYPNKAIGLSEYGCEALNWHTSNPVQGDYTEEYQAYYHEELIKQLFTRPYIWATHVWNMFDFAADARSEGGEDGMNHKGLVTFDRKYKKDAFFAYKAWLSDEPFVHICGKRYVDRVENVTKVTVYSNQPEVELFANGVSLGKQTSDIHFFYFDVPNETETSLVATAGECRDESFIRKVETFNEDYRMKETGDVINWFEITAPDGCFSINDKFGDITANKKGARLMYFSLAKMLLNAKWKARKNKQSKGKSEGIDLKNPDIMKLLNGMSVKRLISIAGNMGPGFEFSKEDVLKINRKLNRIRK